jgi:Tfp pilus assembly protein PilP
MTKINFFLSSMLLVAVLWFSGHSTVLANVRSGDETRPIHVSERVKIVRPEPAQSEGLAQAEVITGEVVETAAADEVPLELPQGATQEAEESSDTTLEEAVAEIDPEGEVLSAEELYYLASETRYYDETGRVDPFAPFLRKPEPAQVEGAEAEAIRRVPRTPLERIALGQLKLTAVVRGDSDLLLAMVEDARGKGYILRMGTYVGENGGRVSRISENRVIVEEPHRDVFGKTSIREVALQIQRTAGE